VNNTLKLNVLSPERRLVESMLVDFVTLPGSEGQIQILPGHAAMIGTLNTGVLTYQAHGQEPVYAVVSTGFFEVKSDEITLMAETIELKKEIDLQRAKNAQQKAETALLDAALDEARFRKYQLKLQRALIRQQVASQ